jgi:hypothetical protein
VRLTGRRERARKRGRYWSRGERVFSNRNMRLKE